MRRTGALISICFVVLLVFSALGAITQLYQARRTTYLAEGLSEMEHGYQAVLETYELFSKAIYNETINKPAVIALMAQASKANPAQRDRLRAQLHRMMLPSYQGLLQNNLNQIHFHLPDMTSFLRMHRPAVFGDNLAAVRPALVVANRDKTFVSGFEMGRHEGGFRFIFPLFQGQTFVGTVETSISFESFTKQLRRRFPGEYLLLVKDDITRQRLFSDIKSHMIASPFAAGLLQLPLGDDQHSDHLSSFDMHQIAGQLRQQLSQAVAANKPVALAAEGKGGVSVYLLPLANMQGVPEAYLLQLKQDPRLQSLKGGYTIASSLAALLALLAGGIIIVCYRRASTMSSLSRLFRQTIDALPYPFHIIDVANYQIEVANAQASQGKKEVAGMACYALSHGTASPCGSDDHPCPIQAVVSTGTSAVVEHRHCSQEGDERVVEVHAYPIVDEKGQITRCIEYLIDITERREIEQRLRQLATTDSLTGVLNRRSFYEALATEISRAERYQHELSVLMLDVDHFKEINDNKGHDVGDWVLTELVACLAQNVRTSDLVGRSGGDEFLILAPETQLADAIALAEKLLAAISQATYNAVVEKVTISIGTASLMAGDTADELIKRADQALYRAKHAGRNRVEAAA